MNYDGDGDGDGDNNGDIIKTSKPSLQTTISITEARYLGSRDSIIVGGNSPSATIQLFLTDSNIQQQTDLGKGDNFKSQAYGNGFKLHRELMLPNILTCMEICYETNNDGTGVNPYVAVATSDKRNRYNRSKKDDDNNCADMACISLYKCANSNIVDTQHKYQASNGLSGKSSSSFTSLAFNEKTSSILAASNDLGEVIIWDLSRNEQLHRFTADACGINKIKFVGGQLLTVGKSMNSQLRLWDLRHAPPIVKDYEYFPILSLIHPLSRESISTTNVELDNQKKLDKGSDHYTCISSDLYEQQKIICGTSSGSIAVWDLRKSRDNIAKVEEHKVHLDQVTSVVAIDNNVISSSVFGTVFNTQINLPSISQPFNNSNSNSNTILFREAAPITCLDKIMDYRSGDVLMATSNIGGMFFKKF